MLNKTQLKPLLVILVALVAVSGLVMWRVYRLDHQPAAANPVDAATANTKAPADGKGIDGTKPSVNDSTAPAAPGTAANPDAASTDKQPNTISITGHQFSPASLTVKKGTAVTWTNQDSTTHAIATKSGGDPNQSGGPRSPQLDPKATYTYTFATAGTFHYYCVIHPDMTGTVTVTE